jgi:hypothetical protein
MSAEDLEFTSREPHLTFAERISTMKNIVSEYKNSVICRESLLSCGSQLVSSSFLDRVKEYKKMIKPIEKVKLGKLDVIKLPINDQSVKDHDFKRLRSLTDLSKKKDHIRLESEIEIDTESMLDENSDNEYCSEVNYDLEEEEIDEEFYVENYSSFNTTNRFDDEKESESAFKKSIDDEALKSRAFLTSLESLQVHLIRSNAVFQYIIVF